MVLLEKGVVMQSSFKHPQIFADLLMVVQVYYPLHGQFPRPFRYAVGDRIMATLTECCRLVVLANGVNKQSAQGRQLGAERVAALRAELEVVRGFVLLAWRLKFLSHAGVTELATRLEVVSKQAARWQQWFAGVGAGAAAVHAPGAGAPS